MWLNIYQRIKQPVEDAVAPEIQGLKGEIQSSGVRLQVSILRPPESSTSYLSRV